jgi:phosphotransferase system  glucose/maltose/N-acetylglucosamine-specific IIC component
MAGLLDRYAAELQHVTHRNALLHVTGQLLLAVAIGVFFSVELYSYAGLMLIIGILLMLPLWAQALKENGKKKRKRR